MTFQNQYTGLLDAKTCLLEHDCVLYSSPRRRKALSHHAQAHSIFDTIVLFYYLLHTTHYAAQATFVQRELVVR